MEPDEEKVSVIEGTFENIRCFAQYAQDCFIILDRRGQLHYVNDYAAGCLGRCPQDLVGKDFGDVLPSVSRDFGRLLQKAVISGEPVSFEHQIVLGERSSWLLIRLSPIKESSGTVIGLLCTAHDITERRQREELIARSKREWLRAVDSMPHLVAVVNRDHRIERVNTLMADRLKLGVRKVVGMVCYKLLHGLRRPPRFCPLGEPTAGGGPDHRIEIAENRLGCESVSVTPIRDVEGVVDGCVFVGYPLRTVAGGPQTQQCIRSLMRKVDHVVRIQDLQGRYMFFAAMKAGTLIHSEVSGRTPFDFFEPGLASRLVERVERVAAGDGELTEVSEVGWKGEIFHFLDRVCPLKDAGGKLLGVVTISWKVAESRRAGEEAGVAPRRAGDLSPREREVLQLIAEGASSKDIALKLGISLKTVETHRARVMEKLEIHKMSDLVRYALETGLV